MSTPTIDEIIDDPILVTKSPVNLYIILISGSGLFLIFFIFFLTERIDLWSSAISFLFFASTIYILFGRYLAKIKLYRHRIEILYYFPWNSSEVFKFDKLIELDHKPMDFLDRLSFSKYKAFQWLFIRNSKGDVCQKRYSINASCDKKLINELRKCLN